MPGWMTEVWEQPVIVRSFTSGDLPACQKLYREGLLGGKLAENDSGLDIDDIEAAYLKNEGNHFWVAEAEDGEIGGVGGGQHHEQGVGEIRRLRVRQDLRGGGIGSALM